jgi:hypothetical protein
MRNGVEYYDPKFVAAVTPLKPGSLRFPGGTSSMAFDWNTGHVNISWMKSLISGSTPLVGPHVASILTSSQVLTQAKGGVWLADFATFAKTFGSPAIICFNGFTDTNPFSATDMALAAQNDGLNVLEWELSNEPYLFPAIFPTAASYAAAMNPHYNGIVSVAPSATVGLFSAGVYTAGAIDYQAWDNGLASVPNRYWNGSSIHIYPVSDYLTATDTYKTLNGVLAHGTVDYIRSYLIPLVGADTPIFITELNCCTQSNNEFLATLCNGIFLAEFMARISSVPNVKAVGVNSLYTDNYDYHGIIQSVNDHESYLLSQVAANPDFSTNTATDPNTQFQFYMSAPGLALDVANQAINGSSQMWPTTVIGGPMVPILGYDGNPIPAIFAQAYMGKQGGHYLVITNKSPAAESVTIRINGVELQHTFTVRSVSNASGVVVNTAQSPHTVQIQTTTSGNPVSIGPFSVTCVMW